MTAQKLILYLASIVFATAGYAQESRWQPPPEDMSIPPVHPLVGFDGPCPTPTGNLLCAHKTYLGCFQSRNPEVCELIGFPLKEALGENYDSRVAKGETYYDRAWTMPFSELTDFFQYKFHGLRLVDESRVSSLDSHNASRLLGTYEVM